MSAPQLTLGALRDVLAAYPPTARVRYSVLGLYWSGLHSWRGAYDCPAIGWTEWRSEIEQACTVASLLAAIDRALQGEAFGGWKGGEYTYDRDSPVWVDNPGTSTETALVGVSEYGDVMLHIEHRRYGA